MRDNYLSTDLKLEITAQGKPDTLILTKDNVSKNPDSLSAKILQCGHEGFIELRQIPIEKGIGCAYEVVPTDYETIEKEINGKGLHSVTG